MCWWTHTMSSQGVIAFKVIFGWARPNTKSEGKYKFQLTNLKYGSQNIGNSNSADQFRAKRHPREQTYQTYV
jgi:hypothetical protein